MTIGEALLASKPAFSNAPDGTLILELLRRWAPNNSKTWLEIGVGDGRHMSQCQRELRSGGSFKTVVIDPELDIRSSFFDNNTTLLPSRFQDATIDTQFDIINSRHSAYYFLTDTSAHQRMMHLLRPNGVLIITLWNENCSLFGLHNYFAKRTNQAPSTVIKKNIISNFANLGATCVEFSSCSGELTIREDSPQKLLSSILDLSLRLLDASTLGEREKADIVRSYIAASHPLQRKIDILAFMHQHRE